MYVIPIYFFNVMVRKVIENISKFFEKKLEVLNSSLRKKKKAVYAYLLQVVDKFLVFFEKQTFVIEANVVAESIIDKYSRLNFSFRKFVELVVERYRTLKSSFRKFVRVVVDSYSILKSFFRSLVENTIGRYIKLKSSFRSSVKRMIEALIVNRLFIAFARLVQKIFWVCAGIGIYACVLIKTQPDGYERVTDVLKHLFPWIW